MEEEKNRRIQVIGLLVLLIIFIFLESQAIIEPKQYHIADQNYSQVSSVITPITASGTATGSMVSLSASPSPSAEVPFDEDYLS